MTRLLTLVLIGVTVFPAMVRAQVGAIAPIRDTEGGPIGARNIEDRLRWSFPVLWDQTITVNSFNEDSQLTYDPSYIWWFTFRPRYELRDDLSVGAQFGFSYEWTNTPAADFNRPGFYGGEVFWEDVRLDVTYTLPWNPGEVHFEIGFNLRLPASKLSRARERILSPGVDLDVSRRFDVLKGLVLTGHAEYWGWFAKSNVATVDFNQYPCRLAPGGGGPLLDNCVGENAAIRHWIAAAFAVTLEPVKRFRLGTGFTGLWGKGFPLAEACTETLTGEVCVGDNSANSRWNTFANFSFFLSYDIASYLRTIVAYDTWSQQPDSDGDRENVFYNENTRIVISFELRLQNLYRVARDRRRAKRASSVVASAN